MSVRSLVKHSHAQFSSSKACPLLPLLYWSKARGHSGLPLPPPVLHLSIPRLVHLINLLYLIYSHNSYTSVPQGAVDWYCCDGIQSSGLYLFITQKRGIQPVGATCTSPKSKLLCGFMQPVGVSPQLRGVASLLDLNCLFETNSRSHLVNI